MAENKPVKKAATKRAAKKAAPAPEPEVTPPPVLDTTPCPRCGEEAEIASVDGDVTHLNSHYNGQGQVCGVTEKKAAQDG